MKKFILILICFFTLNCAFALPWNAPDPSYVDILNAWLDQSFDNLMKYMGPDAIIQDLNDGGRVVQYYKSTTQTVEGYYGSDYYTDKKDYKTGITYHEYHKGEWNPGSETTYEATIRFTINKAQIITMWNVEGDYSEINKILRYPPNFDFFGYYQKEYSEHARCWIGVASSKINVTYPNLTTTNSDGTVVAKFRDSLYIKFSINNNKVESLELVNNTSTPNAFKDNYRDPDGFELNFGVGGALSVWITEPFPKILSLYGEATARSTSPASLPLKGIADIYLDTGLGSDFFRFSLDATAAYNFYKSFYIGAGVHLGGTSGKYLSGFNLAIPIIIGIDWDAFDIRYTVKMHLMPVSSAEIGIGFAFRFNNLII